MTTLLTTGKVITTMLFFSETPQGIIDIDSGNYYGVEFYGTSTPVKKDGYCLVILRDEDAWHHPYCALFDCTKELQEADYYAN